MTRCRSRIHLAVTFVPLAPLLLTALAVYAAPTVQKYRQPQRVPTERPAKGKFLVAERHVPEPFRQSVVLLVTHGSAGTVGLIVNRVTKVALSEVLPDLKPASKSSHAVFFGGPVALDGLMFVYRSNPPPKLAQHVMEDVYFGGERSVLEKLLEEQERPGELRLFLGYAGWGPGQLESEIARGDWHVMGADAKTVFREDVETLWPELIGRVRGTLVALVGRRRFEAGRHRNCLRFAHQPGTRGREASHRRGNDGCSGPRIGVRRKRSSPPGA